MLTCCHFPFLSLSLLTPKMREKSPQVGALSRRVNGVKWQGRPQTLARGGVLLGPGPTLTHNCPDLQTPTLNM